MAMQQAVFTIQIEKIDDKYRVVILGHDDVGCKACDWIGESNDLTDACEATGVVLGDLAPGYFYQVDENPMYDTSILPI